jgi:hypothetical protein
MHGSILMAVPNAPKAFAGERCSTDADHDQHSRLDADGKHVAIFQQATLGAR